MDMAIITGGKETAVSRGVDTGKKKGKHLPYAEKVCGHRTWRAPLCPEE